MGRQSLPFSHAGRESQKNLFPFHMRDGKLKKKFPFLHVGRKIEKNLFPSHAGCGISHPFSSPRDLLGSPMNLPKKHTGHILDVKKNVSFSQ